MYSRKFLIALALSTALLTIQLTDYPGSAQAADRSPTRQSIETAEAQREGEAFQQFMNRPEVQQALQDLRQSSEDQELDLRDLADWQDNLKQIESRSVVLYPLVLEDRLELLLLTSGGPPLRRTVNVTQAELNQAILQFRQALQNPRQDVTPSAQRLYEWLIQPVSADLAAAQAETILYAPDGILRYVPLAALYDGQQWLVERFTINSINSLSSTNLTANRPATRRILAAAFTEGGISVQQGDRTIVLTGYPYAQQEVEQISALFPETTVLLNQAFTPDEFFGLSRLHNVLHLATPILLSTSGPAESFILAGNGQPIRFDRIRYQNLSNVDLIVLSTCPSLSSAEQTQELSDGREIFYLGYMLQQAGAKAVITPLWDVSDQGTQVLMVQFYEALHQNQPVAEALRSAQVALIRSSAAQPKSDIMLTPGSTQPSSFNHPYYWAPFIVIGNGL